MNASLPDWHPSLAEIARAAQKFFLEIDANVLSEAIAAYQGPARWTRHVEITKPAFEITLDVFLHAARITGRHAYEAVVAASRVG